MCDPHLKQIARSSQLLGVSAWAQRIRSEVIRIAAFNSSVLLIGPTGTGKELLAQAIHASSPRAHERFIPVDCAATTGALFASHIFGHAKGAFTGANHAELGCFRAAHGGTIFLDEIGELELDTQAKLLRVLQQRTVVPVGSHEEIPVDVRVISATHRDLEQGVVAGWFREDLYYRLNVITLQTLPLRERIEDLELLAIHILAGLAVRTGMPLKRLSAAAFDLLTRHDWPGNVRQLENVLERAFVLSEGEIIRPEGIPLPCAARRQVRIAAEPLPLTAIRTAGTSGLSAARCCLTSVRARFTCPIRAPAEGSPKGWRRPGTRGVCRADGWARPSPESGGCRQA
jgi:DNA-binding NtrC family response regulator